MVRAAIGEALRPGLAALPISPPAEAAEQLCQYGALLLEQNQHMNLTAITAPADVALLHFLDCAALLPLVDLSQGRLVDVGTGAGFPGVVLKILCPRLEVTLLDSLGKRMDWLETLCHTLGLSGIRCVTGRAEELGHDEAYRGRYDFATARAVASLPQLAELCLPFLQPGGRFLAMKASSAQEELDAAAHILPKLGGGAAVLRRYALPLSETERALIEISKISDTPLGFPRKWAKIKRGF